jgi:hypothetical protein
MTSHFRVVTSRGAHCTSARTGDVVFRAATLPQAIRAAKRWKPAEIWNAANFWGAVDAEGNWRWRVRPAGRSDEGR